MMSSPVDKTFDHALIEGNPNHSSRLVHSLKFSWRFPEASLFQMPIPSSPSFNLRWQRLWRWTSFSSMPCNLQFHFSIINYFNLGNLHCFRDWILVSIQGSGYFVAEGLGRGSR
ncbi:hypothetical protein RchiOBHm_Chr4g0419341 [Rosa chinensis]|uniref:Uncharacterized protein n=1 Tax=Rosa chinensis TaxID=74649 RepID=A0A2P6QXJ8_ROSCH|nr:hypothetical protein RchiOBHm_Chr4g0419341 [Rosa chinensis]